MQFMETYGPWAVVTGASSGIGREYALQLGAAGLNVVLVARRAAALDEVAAELVAMGRKARVLLADLSVRSACQEVVDATDDLDVGLVVNNAGVGEIGPLLASELDDQLMQVAVNTVAPAVLAYGFGERMRIRRTRSGMVVVSSTAALQGVPRMSIYAATKAFDLIFAESLATEWAEHGIDVQALLPGPTATAALDAFDMSASPMAPMSTEAVVRESMSRLGGTPVVVAGRMNRFMAFTNRLFPRRAPVFLWNTLMQRIAPPARLGTHGGVS